MFIRNKNQYNKMTPEEQKAAMEEQKKNCPFCKLVAGEFPSKKVYENDILIAILDIRPASKGHVIVIPKEHYPLPAFMPQEVYKKFSSSLGDISSAMKKALLCKEVVQFSAMGGGAGQQVPHVCVHLIPDAPSQFHATGSEVDKMERDEVISKCQGILNAMLNKNLGGMGYTQPSSSASAPTQEFTKDQVIEIINQNPQLKELIEKDEGMFKKVLDENEQLKVIFEKVDFDEIVAHFKKKEDKKEGASLDDIASLF